MYRTQPGLALTQAAVCEGHAEQDEERGIKGCGAVKSRR